MHDETVLILDDDKDIRDSLQQALEGEGYHVYTAANGKEGLELLKTIPSPSLILLDLMMPVMNGWDFLKALDKDFFLSGIPIVIITAFDEKAQKIGRLAAKGVLKKPFDLGALSDAVKHYSGTGYY